MRKLPLNDQQFVDLQGERIGTINADAVALQYSPAVWVVGFKWVWVHLEISGLVGPPTLVSVQAESTQERGTSASLADWSPLPYEPAVAGTGTTVIYDYVATRAAWTSGTWRSFRFPAMERWMRFGILLDAGTATFLVDVMRSKV